MTTGLTVNGGDTIGKTIIFAGNHEHAVKIVERFQNQYPEYGSDFCVLIDNQVSKAQDLIDSFSVRGKMPQIVVSVDMMDTGIDVPATLYKEEPFSDWDLQSFFNTETPAFVNYIRKLHDVIAV